MHNSSNLLIYNALLIDFSTDPVTVLPNAIIKTTGELIDEITTGDPPPMSEEYDELNALNRVVMPGFINIHTHFYSTFARGMGLLSEPPENFPQILERISWRLDKALVMEDVLYSSLAILTEAIKCGTTTHFDHHASPFAVSNSLDQIHKALMQSRTRGCLCYEVSDRDGKEIAEKGLRENYEFIMCCNEFDNPTFRGLFGLHASFTLSDETLRKAAELASKSNAGFHVHVAEDAYDQKVTLEKFNKRVVERLYDFGILGPSTIAAHCVHITDAEMQLLLKTKTFVAHNPESNLNNAVGIAEVGKMLDKGIIVGLGTDGRGSRMCNSIRLMPMLQKYYKKDPREFGGSQVLDVAFRNPSRFASEIFGIPIGTLQPGAAADLVVLDYVPPTPITPGNALSHLLFGMTDAPVKVTVARGDILYRDGELKYLDRDAIGDHCRELASAMWQRRKL